MAAVTDEIARAARKLAAQLPYLPKAVKLVTHAAGGLAVLWLALLVVQGLLPVAIVYLTRSLVDGLAAVAGTQKGLDAFRPLLPAATAMALVLAGSEMFQALGKWVRTAQSERVQDHVHGLIHEQAMALDLSFYDDPAYYDQLHRARIDAMSRPQALMESAGVLLQSLITLVAMGSVLLSFGFRLPLLLILGTLPALFVLIRHMMRFHVWRVSTTTMARRVNYYDSLLTQREGAAEMRLFGLGPHFRALFRHLRERLRQERLSLARSEAWAQGGAALIGLASLSLALLWIGSKALAGSMSLGYVALLLQAFYQGQRMMRALLGSAGEIYRNVMFLENLFEFLALKPRIVPAKEPLPFPGLKQEILFDRVTFGYPGTGRSVFSDFTLAIPAGRVTALVGENGAGKTTLIKLLCRFYEPESGRILLDGVDLRALSIPSLRQAMAVLFQDPLRYQETAFTNIALGKGEAHPDEEAVERAAQNAGADGPIGRLPQGVRTMLGRWFGGVELSTGEWQRLALARTLFREGEILILDEPTSAMDPWAEGEWLGRFRHLVAGRTVLVITHRLSTARYADLIHVMEEGRVMESGTHDELVRAQGPYGKLWADRQGADLPPKGEERK